MLHIKVYKLNLCNHEMKSLFVVLCLTMAYLSVGAQKIYKFQNTKLSDEKRIDALLEELMLEEKLLYSAAT